MKKLIHAVILFAAVIIAVCVFSYIQSADNTDNTGSYAVDLNEIENLCRQGDTDSAAAKAKELRQEIRSEKREKSGQNAILHFVFNRPRACPLCFIGFHVFCNPS